MNNFSQNQIIIMKTAFAPLASRVYESRRPDALFKDEMAEKWLAALDPDNQMPPGSFAVKANIIRTKIIDDLLAKEIEENNQVTVVNLGAGLDTRFFRLKDKNRVVCIDVDLADNIALKKNLVFEPNYYFVADSILSSEWVGQISDKISGRLVFIIEGVLPYLKESEIKQLFSIIKDNFSDYKIFCTVVSNLFFRFFSYKRLYIGNIKYQWGLKNNDFFRQFGLAYKAYPYILSFPKKWGAFKIFKNLSFMQHVGQVISLWPNKNI